MPNRSVKSKAKAEKLVKNSRASEAKVIESTKYPTKLTSPILTKKIVILAVVIILVAIAYVNKKYLVAATVNGQPITGLEVEQRINSYYRSKTLNDIINEKILEQEAAKKGLTVTPQEVSSKVSAMEQQSGGANSFNALLEQNGYTREQITNQTRLNLLVEKMYSSEATPSAQEIDSYIEQNKDDPAATDAAKFRATAVDSLKQQKLQDVISQKFQQLKQAAKVTTF